MFAIVDGETAEVVSARLARISLAAYSKGLYGIWTDDLQLGGRYERCLS